MNKIISRSFYQKIVWLFWMAGTLVVLACGITGTYLPFQPTDTATSLPPSPSATLAPSATPVQDVTPTLGVRSAWHKGKIAFASNRTGHFQIYLMNPDGSDVTQLTNSAGDNLSPVWSLDGQHIAFASTRDGNSEIYSMDLDGTNQKNLTNDPSNDNSPLWTSNSSIAFVSDRKGRDRIFTMNSDGTNIQSFQNSSIDSTDHFLCILPAGEGYIAFTTEEGGKRQTSVLDLTNGDVWTADAFNTGDNFACPQNVYSTHYLVASNSLGHDEIYAFNVQNELKVQLTFDSTSSLGPSVSSSTDWVVFYSKRTGNWDIYVMEDNGKYQWNITNNPADDIQPAWEPY